MCLDMVCGIGAMRTEIFHVDREGAAAITELQCLINLIASGAKVVDKNSQVVDDGHEYSIRLAFDNETRKRSVRFRGVMGA